MIHFKLSSVDTSKNHPFWKPNSAMGFILRTVAFLFLFTFILLLFLLPKRETTPPTPQPSPQPQPHSGDVQIKLEWGTIDDIDLQCIFSDGEVLDTCDFKHENGVKGGILDVDSNSDSNYATTSPVENIYWPEGKAPKGHYEVSIGFYSQRDSTQGLKPFKIYMKYGNEEKTITGDLQDVLRKRGDTYETLFIYMHSFDLE